MAPQNPLQTWGNEKTMNLNSLILSNIQASPYFKVNLYELKTYHEVIDEIFYKVSHLEPWEKGSRKTAGQTGMCGGVRGVGAGGIVSSAFCLLYKLFTLKLTKKQVIGLITHADSPYIRGLGFMYIRYTQPPGDLWDWYEEYLEDEEEIDVKAGTGHTMAMGEMVRQWLTKLEWYSTLFPRIPVPIQKDIEMKLKNHDMQQQRTAPVPIQPPVEDPEFTTPDTEGGEPSFGEAARISQLRQRSRSPEGGKTHSSSEKKRSSPPFEKELHVDREKSRHKKDRSPERDRKREKDHRRHGSHERERHRRSHSRDRHRRSRSKSRDRQKHKIKTKSSKESKRERKRSRSKSRERRGHKRSRTPENYGSSRSGRESSFERDLRRERERISKQRKENGK